MKNYLPGRDSNALFNYKRRAAHNVQIGNLTMGSSQPIRIQSMANTDTNDTNGSVEQCIRIIKEGGELVRFTAQGVKEAKNLQNISEGLRARGCQVPLVADVHFNAYVADEAALYAE
ncbi:MAG: flavodoxin-dependent (E)-4-hydroxy-3-methylbut-2-enyl-diphosphate synthase, partial [Paludibacteraceae bacterium]|nr:flavodoxin-dependent (E)-4-hydroxy-3-methylbut-2-enyl-diphosphate synthase [Paludibacteraceae bacterium]